MSKAQTVPAYLKELPAERRKVISAVRAVVRKNLPKGLQESMNYGMISYEVPLSVLPDTYNGQPLCYAGLAAQKNHYGLYLMCVYTENITYDWMKQEFKKRGLKLDMGKSCLRFKKLEDIPLDVVGKVVGSLTMKQFIDAYKRARK